MYGIRLLEVLRERNIADTHLIVSESAKQIISIETDYELEGIYAFASHVYDNSDFTAPPCSGSVRYDGAIIVPCSMKTLGCIASGISTTVNHESCGSMLKRGLKIGDYSKGDTTQSYTSGEHGEGEESRCYSAACIAGILS